MTKPTRRRRTSATTLRIPRGLSEMSEREAALAYAECGIYVVPGLPGNPSPGALLGKSWPTKSSRDPDIING